MADNLAKKLRNFFGFDTKKKKTSIGVQSQDKEVVPVKTDKDGKIRKTQFDTETKKLWDWYISQTSDSIETLRNRFERYSDIDYMVYNDTIIASAVDLYADEVSQVDSQTQLVDVEAKPKVQKEIERLLQKWGIDQNYIRECAWNLVAYGDSFDIVDFSEENGIESLVPIDVREISERFEFKASEIAKKKKGLRNTIGSSNRSIDDLIKTLDKLEKNSSKNYKSYLLGFKTAGNQYLPPWGVNHYRLFSRKSEFFPFGRSMFIHLIGPYRQLKTSKNLMALTRALKFPKEIFQVKTEEGMTEIEAWDKVNQARQEYENNGMTSRTKEDFSVGDQIWIPENLISHKTIENNLRIEDIADIELLRDDLVMGTRIPKGYLITSDRGAWGASGQSLLQQSKPFGRAVYYIQSAILESIAHMIRTHFLMTNQFDKEYTEFQISLNFPVVEEAQDRLRMKNDTLRLAKDVADNFKDALGFDRGEPLPPEAIKMIYSNLSFLSQDEVDEIINISLKALEEPEDKDALQEKFLERFSEENLHSCYFSTIREQKIKEGKFNNKHVMHSSSEFIPDEHRELYTFLRQHEERKRKALQEKE